MKRRFNYSAGEVVIAIGFASLLGVCLYPVVTNAVFTFLNGLPWNP